MKKLCSLAILATTTALLAVTAPSASADDTAVTFNLAGGGLSVTTTPAVAWGDKGTSGTTSVDGTLGTTTVTDIRGGITGWTARAASTDFDNSVADNPATTEVNEAAAATTTAESVSYDSGLPSSTGVVVATSSGPTSLSTTPATVVTASAVLGNNTATWSPTLTVTLPDSSTAGTYRGTVTTSVL